MPDVLASAPVASQLPSLAKLLLEWQQLMGEVLPLALLGCLLKPRDRPQTWVVELALRFEDG